MNLTHCGSMIDVMTKGDMAWHGITNGKWGFVTKRVIGRGKK